MTTQQRDGQEALREATEVAGDRDRARVGYQRQCAAAMTIDTQQQPVQPARFYELTSTGLLQPIGLPDGLARRVMHYELMIERGLMPAEIEFITARMPVER